MKAGRSQKRTARGRVEARQPSLHLPPDVLDKLAAAVDWLRSADRELARRVEALAVLPARNVLLLGPGGEGRVLVNPEAVRSVPARELAGLLARLVAFDLHAAGIGPEAYRAERERLERLEERITEESVTASGDEARSTPSDRPAGSSDGPPASPDRSPDPDSAGT